MPSKKVALVAPRELLPVKKRVAGVVRKTETVKLWKDTVNIVNKHKRNTPPGEKMPSTPAIVDFAVRTVIGQTETLPTREDIMTPAHKRLYWQLAQLDRSSIDPQVVDFIFSQIGPSARQDVREIQQQNRKKQ